MLECLSGMFHKLLQFVKERFLAGLLGLLLLFHERNEVAAMLEYLP